MKRTLAAAAMVAAALGSTVGFAGTASADSVSAAWGSLEAYQNSDDTGHYIGKNWDGAPTGGCTTVEGKINGSYTSDGIAGGGKTHCYGDTNTTANFTWTSTASFYSNATAIRIRDVSGRTLYICTNRTDCQNMESGYWNIP